MEHLSYPLSDTEEALLELLKKVEHLKSENEFLKKELEQLKWIIQEQD